jgi:hypothetical protein
MRCIRRGKRENGYGRLFDGIADVSQSGRVIDVAKKRSKRSHEARPDKAIRKASAKRKQSRGTTKGQKPNSKLRDRARELSGSLRNRIDSNDVYHITIRQIDSRVKEVSGDIDSLIKLAQQDKTQSGRSILKVLKQIKEGSLYHPGKPT